MAHDVFISYASPDKVVADAICNKLESNNIRICTEEKGDEKGEEG